MQQHLFHQHFTCIFHSQGDHGQAVPHQDHFDPRSIGDVTAGEVMSGEHRNWLTLLVEVLQRLDSDLLPRIGGRCSQRGVTAMPDETC